MLNLVERLKKQSGICKKDVDEIIDILGSAADIINECPAWPDKATIPRGGIDVAPEQVVMEMSIAYTRYMKLKHALEKSGLQKVET